MQVEVLIESPTGQKKWCRKNLTSEKLKQYESRIGKPNAKGYVLLKVRVLW